MESQFSRRGIAKLSAHGSTPRGSLRQLAGYASRLHFPREPSRACSEAMVRWVPRSVPSRRRHVTRNPDHIDKGSLLATLRAPRFASLRGSMEWNLADGTVTGRSSYTSSLSQAI